MTASPTAAPSPAVHDTLITIADLADILCVSRRCVFRWVAEGKLPAPIKLSRNCSRWKASEIQAYLDSLKT